MAFINRDDNNKIISVYGSPQYEGQEHIPEGDQEYLDFINPPKTYQELRKEAYGSIGDQLDMLYQDKVNGTSIWEDHITAVKNDIPKT